MPDAALDWSAPTAPRRSRASGFFTDTSLCIGCKACEVACKEWNHVPDDIAASPATPTTTRARSAPTRGATSRSSSRRCRSAPTARRARSSRPPPPRGSPSAGLQTYQEGDGLRWLMASDVCKHCTDAACLDVCPTGALFRTEFGTVVVQEDVCNGCGYCVPGVPVRRARPARGRRPRVEVHALLRPPQGRQGARLRAGVPDRTRSSSASSTSCASAPRSGSSALTDAGRTTRACTSPTRTTASAAPARSSCCSTSPRSTGCRPTPSTPRATSGGCGRRPARRRSRSAPGSRRRCSAAPAMSAEGATVPRADWDSYYGQPVLKAPVWTPEIPCYFFTGGSAGASAVLALLARGCAATTSSRAARGSARSPASARARRC